MRIALISDIHANLPALEACLESIAEQQPDVVYCLGDLVGYNVWPNEVIDLIQQKEIPTIVGNYDQGIGLGIDDCGCAYKSDIEKEMGKVSINYTNKEIGEMQRSYLRTLPESIRLEFVSDDDTLSILFVHGSPRKINEYLFEERNDKSFLRILEQANADVLCFGHTHKPFHKVLKSTNESGDRFRHAINTGSVGKPKDGNPQGGYVILHLEKESSNAKASSVCTEFIRFDYDVEKAAMAILDSALPNGYADKLRSGI